MVADKNLGLVENDLRTLRRVIDGMMTEDFEAQYDAHMLINSIFRALEEHKLELQPVCENIPAGVPMPKAA